MAYSLSYSKAILVLVFISDKTRRGETEFISAKNMSELMNIPKPTLSVILNNLIRAGILISKEGVHGGVQLARSEDQIDLLDVLLAIESSKPLFQTEYSLNASGKRPESVRHTVGLVLKNAENRMQQELKKTTLRVLLDQM